jgi:dTDP-4-dehydrorhamnose 3,5-epimerase
MSREEADHTVDFDVEPLCADPDVRLVRFSRVVDDRGTFSESYRAEAMRALGLPHEFPQDVFSRSSLHVLRGMHFQRSPLMGKLIRVTRGRALLVARNVHPDSPHFGGGCAVELSEDDCAWVWAPGWYARGYLALAPVTEVLYKCTVEYDARTDTAVLWDDPTMSVIEGSPGPVLWPLQQPSLSDRDRQAPTLAEALDAGLLDFARGPA